MKCILLVYILHIISVTVPSKITDLTSSFSETGAMFNSDTRMYTLDLIATWNDPIYPNGVITSYELNLTQLDTGDVVYSNDSLLVRNVTESVMVLPYTNYTVTVAASTVAGQGVETTIIILSPEAGKSLYQSPQCIHFICVCVNFITAAPGVVRELSAFFDISGSEYNTTSRVYTLNIDISWIEPINPNGVITAYNVTVYQTDDSSDIVYSNDAVTDLAVTESVMVLPYTNYTVTVAASTSAGQGDETTITILSPEAGKHKSALL